MCVLDMIGYLSCPGEALLRELWCLNDPPSGLLEQNVATKFACAGGDAVKLHEAVREFRGKSFWLSRPDTYTLNVCSAEDTILTHQDLQAWRGVPGLMGEVNVFGTLGPNYAFCWDRWPVAVCGDSRVYAFHTGIRCNVLRVSDSLSSLISDGASPDYMLAVANLNRLDAAMDAYAPWACKGDLSDIKNFYGSSCAFSYIV